MPNIVANNMPESEIINKYLAICYNFNNYNGLDMNKSQGNIISNESRNSFLNFL